MKGAGGGTRHREPKGAEAGCDAVICCNAPEEVDQMLQELLFEPDAGWRERASAVDPKPFPPNHEELLASNVYKNFSFVDDNLNEKRSQDKLP